MTKGRCILLLLFVSGLTLLTLTQTWVRVSLPATGVQQEMLSVPGTKASPAMMALLIVSIAAILAAATTGRITRYISLSIAALAVAMSTVLSFTIAINPLSGASTQIAEKIGVMGANSGAEASVSFWPWLCSALGMMTFLLCLYVAFLSKDWVSSGKYSRDGAKNGEEAPAASEQARRIDEWDELSKDHDPTA